MCIQMYWSLCLDYRIAMPRISDPYARYAKYMYIYTMLTNIGYRFVHQSGLDESSGRKSTTFLHGFAFRVYLMFSEIGKNTKD